MRNVFLETADPALLKQSIEELASDEKINGLLIFSCDGNEYTPEQIDPILKEVTLPIIGGIFPKILYGKNHYDQGNIIVGLSKRPQVLHIPDLSNKEVNFEAILEQVASEDAMDKTMFVFVDGLSSQISRLIGDLFNQFGLDLNYIGGGAGSLSFQKKPCLFTNSGLKQDSAVIGIYDKPSGIGVNHGWMPISGPYKVTESANNIIYSLDWEPAENIYKKVLSDYAGININRENFFDHAKGYPFGINKLNSEKVVRDPIMIDEKGGLVCVGEVPQGCFVDILRGRINL